MKKNETTPPNVENIAYFCNVETYKFRKALLLFFLILLIPNRITAQNESVLTKDLHESCDSIEISLLTCSPHDEVYSLYGHTAIRYQDKSKGLDLAINYGVFSFEKPYFILRFIFGRTDYEMGILDFDDFCKEYNYYGSEVIQQTLNLSAEEKLRITNALQINFEPQNRIYRYNYFYNNCTTKARDIIVNNIIGHVIYNNRIDEKTSFRDMIHSCNENHTWARFGNDILLGVKADLCTTRSDQQFLPRNLQRDFERAIKVNAGSRVKLVKSTSVVVDGKQNSDKCEKTFFTPLLVSFTILFFTILVCAIEKNVKRKYYCFDLAFMFFCGLAGIILFAMLFSLHPTTSTNMQILIFNPIPLFLIFYCIKKRKEKKKIKALWLYYTIVLSLAIICSFIQTFAEGIRVLALSLLIRSLWNFVFPTKETFQNIKAKNNEQ